MDAMVRPPLGMLRRVLPTTRRVFGRLSSMPRLFLWVAVIPTALAVVYYGLIAHDVYVSESHIVVRSPQHQAASGIGTLLQGTGISQGSDDVYTVQDFLSSRDALEKLEARFHLKKSFRAAGLDRLSRFPALDGDDSFEGLLRFYRDHVISTDLDSTSSILTLTVRAFSAADAYRINEALLEMSEEFVNKLNERARQDLIQFASADVEIAERRAKSSVLALSDFRNTRSVFDPIKQSGLQLEQVVRLQEELIATRKEIADIGSVAKNNPQIPLLQNRVKVLESDIEAEMSKVAGGVHSLSSKSAEYDGLVLERDFSAKRLELALSSLAQARENAMKQQLYLERIAQPNTPDVAIEPRRIRNVLATLTLSLIAWGVVSLLVTAVREHAD